MKLILTFLFAGVLAIAGPISGNTTVTLANAGNGVNDGSYYVGPYTLDVGGKAYPVMCVDFVDDSYIGASWTAHFTNLSPTQTDFSQTYLGNGTNTAKIYEEEAYLYNMIVSTNDPTTRVDIQHAAWSLTDPNYALNRGSQKELLIAENNYQSSWFQAELPYYEVVSDISKGGREQEFLIASAPEPQSLALFGAGLLLVTGILRRFTRN